MRILKGQRGSALIETAVTLPMLLLVAVAIFEFGRAFQTWQVLTNAAREGARVSVTPTGTPESAEGRVRDYLSRGSITAPETAQVSVDRDQSIDVNGEPSSASKVIIRYPFDFAVLQPIARLVAPGTSTGAPFTMRAEAQMRNEVP